MKKLLIAFMCISFLAGCGNKDSQTKNDTTNDSTYNEISDKTDGITDTTGDWFTRFEAGLDEKNIKYSSKTSIDGTTIGAKEGYRYQTDNGNIDVYRFEDGDDFNKILQNKKVSFNGTDYQNVEVNDHYVIVSQDVKDDVLDIFRGLK